MDLRACIDFERRTQFPIDLGEVSFPRPSSGDHHDVTRWLYPIMVCAEELAHHSFNPIPHDGATHSAAGGDTEARDAAAAGRSNDHESYPCPAPPCLLDLEVLAAFADALHLGERLFPERSRQPGCFAGMLTVRRFRPLARRRFNT